MQDRLFSKDVEVLYGVVKDDACHSDTSEGIGHVDTRVGQVTG